MDNRMTAGMIWEGLAQNQINKQMLLHTLPIIYMAGQASLCFYGLNNVTDIEP